MKIDLATVSKRGGREKNQDYLDYLLLPESAGFVVADGLGGHEGGEVASQIVTTKMLKTFGEQSELTARAMEQMVAQAQSELLQNKELEPRYKDMCSTVTMLRLGFGSDGQGKLRAGAMWAHVGDSRIYHFRNGKVLGQTKDHSVPQALVNAGEITPEQIRSHEDRNRLLRALGMDGEIKASVSGLTDIEPGDAFLLCTDGFWEYVLESEMEHLLQVSANGEAWLTAMEQMLLSRATGEHDNYSALAVRVLGELDQVALTVARPGERGPVVRIGATGGAGAPGDSGASGGSGAFSGSATSGAKFAGAGGAGVDAKPNHQPADDEFRGRPVWREFGQKGAGLFTKRSWKMWTAMAAVTAAMVAFVFLFVIQSGQDVKAPGEGSGSQQIASEDSDRTDADRLKPQSDNTANDASKANATWDVGDYVQFGQFEGAPLVWRVIDMDENRAPLLLSEQILPERAFDEDVSGETGDRKLSGNNNYEQSDLRKWLNGDVAGQFLADEHFTPDEKSLMLEKANRVIIGEDDKARKSGGTEEHSFIERFADAPANAERAYYQEVRDKVFLLNVQSFKENVVDQTQQLGASAISGTRVAGDSAGSPYWLMDATGENGFHVRIVNPGNQTVTRKRARDRAGVRPVIVLDQVKLTAFFGAGDGSQGNPRKTRKIQ